MTITEISNRYKIFVHCSFRHFDILLSSFLSLAWQAYILAFGTMSYVSGYNHIILLFIETICRDIPFLFLDIWATIGLGTFYFLFSLLY